MKLCILDNNNFCVNVIEARAAEDKFLQPLQKYAPDHSGDVGMLWAGGAWRNVTPEPTPTEEEIAERVRTKRNSLLAASDWVVTKAVDQNAQDNLGIQVPQVWLDYRQELRDITDQDGFPQNVVWPTKP